MIFSTHANRLQLFSSLHRHPPRPRRFYGPHLLVFLFFCAIVFLSVCVLIIFPLLFFWNLHFCSLLHCCVLHLRRSLPQWTVCVNVELVCVPGACRRSCTQLTFDLNVIFNFCFCLPRFPFLSLCCRTEAPGGAAAPWRPTWKWRSRWGSTFSWMFPHNMELSWLFSDCCRFYVRAHARVRLIQTDVSVNVGDELRFPSLPS